MSDTGTVASYPSDMIERLARLEQIADDTRRVLERLDGRMDRLDSRMDRFDARFDRMDVRIDGLHAAMRTQFYWTLGAFAALLGVMARGFHWL